MLELNGVSYYDVKDVAVILGVGRASITRLCKEGAIPAGVVVGAKRLWLASERSKIEAEYAAHAAAVKEKRQANVARAAKLRWQASKPSQAVDATPGPTLGLRDWFAGMALRAIYVAGGEMPDAARISALATGAYAIADAMIATREANPVDSTP